MIQFGQYWWLPASLCECKSFREVWLHHLGFVLPTGNRCFSASVYFCLIPNNLLSSSKNRPCNSTLAPNSSRACRCLPIYHRSCVWPVLVCLCLNLSLLNLWVQYYLFDHWCLDPPLTHLRAPNVVRIFCASTELVRGLTRPIILGW